MLVHSPTSRSWGTTFNQFARGGERQPLWFPTCEHLFQEFGDYFSIRRIKLSPVVPPSQRPHIGGHLAEAGRTCTDRVGDVGLCKMPIVQFDHLRVAMSKVLGDDK